jgi:hypothetical protein
MPKPSKRDQLDPVWSKNLSEAPHPFTWRRAETISKFAQKPAREQSRFGKEFSALPLGWGARTRTWEWRNQNPPISRV